MYADDLVLLAPNQEVLERCCLLQSGMPVSGASTSIMVKAKWTIGVRLFEASETVYVQEQNAEIAGHTSLAVYSSWPRLGVRLMTNLRLGTLMLMKRVAAGLKWPSAAGS